jgi:hypothetical protein
MARFLGVLLEQKRQEMTSALFWLLACFFNALCDTVENENFFESRLKNFPKQFWYKRDSWKYAPKIFKYRLDAWHISKSCMVLCFLFTALCFDLPLKKRQDWALYIAVAGVVWIAGFRLFYHVIFKVK